MSVIYLLNYGISVHKNGGRLIVKDIEGQISSVPLLQVEQLVVSYNCQITTQTIFALLGEGCSIVYVTKKGIVAGVLSKNEKTVKRLLCQADVFADKEEQLSITQSLLKKKVITQQRLLEKYAKSKVAPQLKTAIKRLKIFAKMLDEKRSISELRGLEGMTSRIYFSCFPYILDQSVWHWTGRNRRPPKDGINALLSYGYAFLEKEVRLAIIGAGLDCRLGFFHANNDRKDSLVYDLMEMFRCLIIDQFTLKLANYRMFSPEDFLIDERGGCYLSDTGRAHWISLYETMMTKDIQSLGGISCRAYIRKEINKFAENIWFKHKSA